MDRKTVFSKRVKRIAGLFACLLFALLLVAATAFAENEDANNGKVNPIGGDDKFSAVVYDSSNGLPTSVANDVAQTDDGFIWIASYGGLIRYDGNDFERIDSTKGINSVGDMVVDSQNRMWIGTNENGLAQMENGFFRWWTVEDGLAADKVRAIVEGTDGTIYAGTIAGISMISQDGTVKTLDNPKIANAYIEQMEVGSDGVVYCITSAGDYFSIRGDKLQSYIDHSQTNIRDMISILPDPEDPSMVYIGTEESKLYHSKAKGNPSDAEYIDVSPLNSISNMEEIDGNIWICARNGIGLIDEKGFHHLNDLPFQYSIQNVIQDYEGNLWFASSRQGVMKLTPNRFSNIFDHYNIPAQVVNCTRLYEEKLFCGGEEGLIVIDKNGQVPSVPLTEAKTASGEAIPANDLVDYLDGCRIRSIILDSKDRLWISTWQSKGLLRYDHGKLTVFNEDTGLPSDRIRVVHETDNGSLLVGCTGGVYVIEGDQVTDCYDDRDGIDTLEILAVTTAPNGDILVGSNGGGIYIIGKNGIRCIDKKAGLTSGVVMRIYYDEKRDVFWTVTGNSIAYLTSDKYKVNTIKEFPYPDNLDMYENSRGEIWVLSSDGIYIVSKDQMLANKEIDYTHYGIPNGLPGTAVSNSYSELTDEGILYIAANTGVVKVDINAPVTDYSDIKQDVPFIQADDRIIYPDKNGEFNVPAKAKKVTIYGFVFNYSLSDPQVTCQLQGFDQDEMTFRQSELHPMVYTNLKGGSYTYVMHLKDESGKDSKTTSVVINKKMSPTESIWFNILIVMAAMAFVVLLAKIYNQYKMMRLEQQHKEEAERTRVNNELQMASRIQMGMLPHEFPPFPDRHEFDIYASSDPAREVGGDFYDFFLIDDDHLCLVIADVSGKGIPASLYMMNSKVVLQVIAKTSSSVEEILERVNQALCENNQLEMFITVWVGVLELSTGKLVASNAGHEYPAFKQGDGQFELYKDKHGLVLGAMEDVKYKGYELQLQPGDKIFVYTDGLPEATDAELKMFGKDKMLAAINKDPEASPEQILTNVRSAVDAFVKDAEQFDDLTMLCVEYKGK